MKWPTTDELRLQAQLPEGYQFEQFDRAHIAPLISGIKLWYSDISVGANSGYLREDYYLTRVCFEGDVNRDIWVSPISFRASWWVFFHLSGKWILSRSTVDS